MDEQLGQKLRSVDLRSGLPLTMGGALIVLIAIAGTVFLFAPPFGILVFGAGIVVIVLSPVIFSLVTLNEPKKVDIHEHGLVITSWRSAKIVYWHDVTGVQLNQYSDVYEETPVAIPFVVPGVLMLFIGRLLIGGGRRYRHVCRYVFHLADHSQVELKSDARLFDLVKDIKTRVFSRVVPETISQFKKGSAIPLTISATYSVDGLKGTLIRQTSHSRREIPLNLNWSDVERLSRSSEQFCIKPVDRQAVFISMEDIINAPAFLKVLATLSDEGKVPPVY